MVFEIANRGQYRIGRHEGFDSLVLSLLTQPLRDWFSLVRSACPKPDTSPELCPACCLHLFRGSGPSACTGIETLRLLKRNNGDKQMGDLATYFWIAVAAIILLVDLWAIVSVFRSDKSDAVKVMWSLILIVLPVVGLAIWGVAGPRGIKRGTGPTSPEHSKG